MEELDESELSQMQDLQSTGTKRVMRTTDSSPPLWSSATTLSKKFEALSALEGGEFLHTLLELS